jgi:hypothetical protein
MRVLVGLAIGLLIGFAAAIFAYPLWEGRGNVAVWKSDREQVSTSEAFYICSTKFVKDRPLVVKSINGVAKSMTMNWTGQDNYSIEKTDDVSYTAYARREDNGFDQIILNRVTGELNFADHPSDSSKSFLADLCAQRMPWSECEKRMPSIKGGRPSECTFVVNQFSCPRLINIGLISEVQFQCVPTERRF